MRRTASPDAIIDVILNMLMAGKTFKEISFELGISEISCRVRLFKERRKCGMRSNYQMIAERIRSSIK